MAYDIDNIKLGLTYDDVLLVPKFSDIVSRKNIDISTVLTKKIKLNIPMVSGNMDTVTESRMAITMARLGGIGIIHRYNTIQEQVNEVIKVKRHEAIIIDTPYTLTPDHTLKDAKNLMFEKHITGIPIVDNVGRFVGILTSRDILFEENPLTMLSQLMTPKENAIVADFGINIETAKSIFKKEKVEKVPLLDKNGLLKGMITAKDIIKKENYPNASKDSKGRLLVGAAVGVKDNYLERAEALVNSGCDIICIDIAHGHSQLAINAIKNLKDKISDVQIIAGNVVTEEASYDLINAGADCIKVGIGSGCFAAGTRILMANGTYKNIEEIKPGERIINKNGKPVNVKNSFCTGVKIVSKLRSSIFYTNTYVTPDHQYWIGDLSSTSIDTIQGRGYAKLLEVQSKTIPKKSKYKWKPVSELKQDVILMPNNLEFELNGDFKIILEKRTGGNWKIGYKYETEFILKPDYDLGYILGTFLGDGTAHHGINKKNNSHVGSVRWFFGLEELEIAEKLIKSINKVFKKEAKIKYTNRNTIEVRFFYKPFADFLQKFGKKHNKYLPNQYLINNKEYLLGLLHGLVDSDGYPEEYGRINFFNSSNRLIELFCIVSYLLNDIFPNCEKERRTIGGLKGTKLENIKPNFTARIITTGEKRLTKEYQIAKILENQTTEITVPVYDLEIDCPTHSFIANNAIVHNSICVTRLVAGAGYPQFSALVNCAKVGNEVGIPVMADGGISGSPGNFAKAIAAGASTIMRSRSLAGTEESPGMKIMRNGKKYKIYRGSASFGANISRNQREGKDIDENYDAEGVEALTPYSGNVEEVIKPFIFGLRSGMSYAGAHNIIEFWKNAEFVAITNNGIKESFPHDIELIK